MWYIYKMKQTVLMDKTIIKIFYILFFLCFIFILIPIYLKKGLLNTKAFLFIFFKKRSLFNCKIIRN